MALIYIIRHGESVGNIEGRMGGLTDFPLTDEGLAQARKIAHAVIDNADALPLPRPYDKLAIENVPFTTIYTSPLTRAKKTAEIFVEILKGRQNEEFSFVVDERIVEVKTGELNGIPFSQLGRFREIIEVKPYRPELRFPGGESIEELINRTRSFAHELLLKHVGIDIDSPKDSLKQASKPTNSACDERVAIFGHQLPINYLLHHLLNIPADGLLRFPVGNASLSLISFTRGFGELLLYNWFPAR